MIFGQDRNELRQMYVDAWQKSQANGVLSPLEAQIANVIAEHPEYHALLNSDLSEGRFLPKAGSTNPFLHMGLHLALREQVTTDRPVGIAGIFNSLRSSLGNSHDTEHRMIDCLAEALWSAQRNNQPPDEMQYLEQLRMLGA